MIEIFFYRGIFLWEKMMIFMIDLKFNVDLPVGNCQQAFRLKFLLRDFKNNEGNVHANFNLIGGEPFC